LFINQSIFKKKLKIFDFYEKFVDLRSYRKPMEKLTQQEEEAMQVVWQISEGFIKDVLDEMPEPKPPYTTLASTVKNLERKGFVKGSKMGNSFKYSATIKEEDYKKRFMNGFVNNYFQNSYKELVTFFAENKKISANELQEIINMIENPKNK
jgi:BlaI family penicillinase repressor